MMWHYHDEDIPGPDANVRLTLSGLPIRSGKSQVRHFRIDQEHNNAYTLWKEMGFPQQPTARQYAQLGKAGQLTEFQPMRSCRVEKGTITLQVDMPRHVVSLLMFEWNAGVSH